MISLPYTHTKCKTSPNSIIVRKTIVHSINLQDDIDQKKVVKNVKPDSLHGKGGYKRYNKTSNFLNYQVKTHRFDFSPFSEPSAVGACV